MVKQKNIIMTIGIVAIFLGLFPNLMANSPVLAQQNSTTSQTTEVSVEDIEQIKSSLDQAIAELQNNNLTGALNHIDTSDNLLGDVEDQLERDLGQDDD
ncbi:hypothetical protein [Candidatus Nitrosocosmicus franklandus]|uniref:Uncharacterized protein n=1 Tax=Candidatus Nitrosocosmicus franklandianus TaxID=1798806 RepID=A0A484IC77_9ARCH|nr:hypothetical protein [Candidatus Nitrosocosmicus franklandus]VFJ14925.1 exported protein of unknown function [Candidatus Nitrosocosmicus franklandus]